MHRAHKIRMYPTKAQTSLLWQAVGASRFTYNWGLDRWNKMWEAHKADHRNPRPSYVLLSRIWTKEKPEWTLQIARCTTNRSLKDLGTAWNNFFKGLARLPVFKKKKDLSGSFYVERGKSIIKGKKIRIPNVGWMKLSEELRFSGKIMSYTVSTYAGKWYVSVSMEVPEETKEVPDTVIGIDVGLDNPAWDSDNNHLQLPEKDLEKLERKLKRAQKALSRSQRNSKNSYKKLLRKQKVQDKINNTRSDISHKYTTAVCKNHATVVIEDLDIEGMIEKAPARAVRRAFNSSLMRAIHWQLSYKAKKLIKAPRFYPSSKTCSHCGAIKSDLKITERVYKCPACSLEINRDYNAALNLMKIGLVKSEFKLVETPNKSL